MSESIKPASTRPHSIRPAAIGNRLKSGHGCELAKVIWWNILARGPGPVSRTNINLGDDAGISWSSPEQQTERAMKCLREASMLTTEMTTTSTGKWGRVITPTVAAHAQVFVPGRDDMTNLWETCQRARERPAALVTLTVALHVLAAHRLGQPPTDWARVPVSMSFLRRFVGATMGSAFGRRLADLERLELIRRGPRVAVAPVDAWAVGMRRTSRR